MYIMVLGLPLIGTVVAFKEGKITTKLVGIAAIISMYGFYEVGVCGNVIRLQITEWIPTMGVNWGIQLDSLTVLMLVVVTGVSTMVHWYSEEYMGASKKFMSYLSLFTLMMLILVTASNYLQLFVGWEGVGLCSYMLINYWSTRIKANKAAIQAMLVNRIGDIGLAIGIMGLYVEGGTIEYAVLGSDYGWWIGIMLLIGAAGKSAQIGLHTWLPNAMEGPTPVSSLIHAATMVTAGVFLLARSSHIIERMGGVLDVIIVVGGMTALIAGTIGMTQNDMKKVIAYSTASQLGYMVMACGLSAYAVGMFHVLTHACFKALLFMSAGSVIHAMGDEQDMRKMGGIVRLMPLTYVMCLIGSLALMGVPYLAGYYSKEGILEVALAKTSIWGYMMGCLAAMLTAYYSVRLIRLTYLNTARGYRNIMGHVHEPTIAMIGPMYILSIGSVIVGYLGKDMLIGEGTDFWGNAIYVSPMNWETGEYLTAYQKMIPVMCMLIGIGLNYIPVKIEWRRAYVLFNRRWLFDKLYTECIIQPVMEQGYKTTYKRIDRGVLEMIGPYGISNWGR